MTQWRWLPSRPRVQPEGAQKARFSKWSLVFGLAAVTYTIGVVVGYQFSPIFLYLGYLGALTMAGMSLVAWTRGEHPIVPEVLLLGCFVGVAGLTGLALAVDQELLFDGIERMAQVLIVAGCLAGLAARLRSPAVGFISMLAVAVLLGAYGLVTGDFAGVTELTARGGQMVGTRASSMTSNPNTLGIGSVWGLAAVAFLAPVVKRRWLRVGLWGLTPLLTLSALASASRKALVLPVLFLAAWVWFCHRRWLLRRWQSAAATGVLLAVLLWGLPWVRENTFVGQRLGIVVDQEGEFFQTSGRAVMYREAAAVLRERPLLGVGLSQWKHYGSGGYAHSDFLEVAATTGLVGLAMYLLPYLLAFRRLRRVHRAGLSIRERYQAGVSLAVLVTVAASSFALVLFSSLSYWVLMAPIWGFAYGADRAIAAQRHLVRSTSGSGFVGGRVSAGSGESRRGPRLRDDLGAAQ